MGLDMYLYAEEYASGYAHNGDGAEARFRQAIELLGINPAMIADDSPHADVRVAVAYWRKANAVHKWFVLNVQGGEDECKPHTVSREQAGELLDLCRELLTARESMPEPDVRALVEERLPPTSGFFFGSTEIDEWFWQDIQYTADRLTRVLADESIKHAELIYRSSW